MIKSAYSRSRLGGLVVILGNPSASLCWAARRMALGVTENA